MTSKRKTSFTLSAEALTLLDELATAYSISRTAVLEVAIREKAERRRLLAKVINQDRPFGWELLGTEEFQERVMKAVEREP